MRCQPKETQGGLRGAEVTMAEQSSHIQQQQQEMESSLSLVSSVRQWVCICRLVGRQWGGPGSHHLCQQRAHPWGLGTV